MLKTVTVLLTLTASLSSLLTFAHLFQLKEWRWDRLREHLRSEGWIVSILGRVRPIVVIGGISLLQLSHLRQGYGGQAGVSFQLSALTIFTALTFLNIIQILLRKQPYPVWTKKAVTLVGTNLILTGIAAQFSIFNSQFSIVLIPLLQPFFILASWTLWKPVDYILKHRILTRACALRAQFPNLTVIGITGSAGKTTTKELLAHILQDLHPLATPEHVNTELGVAQWLMKKLLAMSDERSAQKGLTHKLKAHSSKLIALVEMGAYHQGEIRTLCAVVQPTMGIITSIGTQHIGLFGSQKAIAEAKGELFTALPKSGHAFVNIDTPFAQELRKSCPCPVTTVSCTTAADIQATHIEQTPEGFHFRIRNVPFTLLLQGEHQLGNTLLAIAAAAELGMTLEDIGKQIRTFHSLAHTFTIRRDGDITILDDTHNASPESLLAAIEWARHQSYKKKILLTPGIIEQGRAAARTHVRCGALAKEIFDEAYILNKKFAQYFEQGFDKPVHHLIPTTYHLPPNTLLVCVGRGPQNIIQKFLP